MRRWLVPVVLGAAVALAGCHGVKVQLNGPTTDSGRGGGGSSAVLAPGPVSAGSGALTLLSEPQAGLGQVYKLINGAKSSIDLTMYELRDTTAGTRDFAVIDTGKSDVAAIIATFNADFAHQAVTPPDGAGLVWSPTNSQAAILAVISSARHTLSVENEEMGDSTITSALEAAARRGVDVKIVMTAQSSWDSAFRALVKAGAHVRTYRNSSTVLYIHAKAVVADAGRPGEQVFAGSENFSVASLRYNRELGIRTTNKQVISAVATVVGDDYAGGSSFS